MLIVSVEPAPEVTTLPYVSSVATVNVVSAVPAAPVEGGAVLKPSFTAVSGVTVIALLACVPPDVVSDAVKVHEPDVSMATPANVAVPPDAVSVKVPVSVHDEEIVIESVAVPPVSMTVKPNVEPAAMLPDGRPANARVALAAAGSTPTRAKLAIANTDAAPAPSRPRAFEWTERPDPFRFILISICISSICDATALLVIGPYNVFTTHDPCYLCKNDANCVTNVDFTGPSQQMIHP